VDGDRGVAQVRPGKRFPSRKCASVGVLGKQALRGAPWRATVTDERIILPGFQAWDAALREPVRHLDFETVGAPIPVFAGTHPFEVVPLQYSVHIEPAEGDAEHREFLAAVNDPDPRGSLVWSAACPQRGTLLRPPRSRSQSGSARASAAASAVFARAQ